MPGAGCARAILHVLCACVYAQLDSSGHLARAERHTKDQRCVRVLHV